MSKINEIKNWVIDQVLWVENNFSDKSGKDKKAMIIKKIDDLIKLPFYLEFIDDIIISSLVDQVCDKLNFLTQKNFKGFTLTDKIKNDIINSIETTKEMKML